MTIEEILRDEGLRRAEFPVCAEKVFLAHAAVCPLPRRVSGAMQEYLRRAEAGDQEEVLSAAWFRELRGKAACLLGARVEEVALVGPTSLALSFVAAGLRCSPGQNVLVYQDDYPSNVYPWMALAGRGVEVRYLRTSSLGRITLEDIRRQVDERTCLVALSSCHFMAGFRIDVESIGEFLRGRGILFCLDAIQTLGVFPTPAGSVDYLAADAHKWLLGPCAAGLLYVRREVQDSLPPVVFGWHNVRCPGFVAQPALELRPDARRYEAGTANLTGLVGLGAALDLVLEIGVESMAAELLRKREWVIPALQGKGYTVLEADASPAQAGGIMTFFREGEEMARCHAALREKGIVASLRTDRQGRQYLRLSPHFYNTDEELQRCLDVL